MSEKVKEMTLVKDRKGFPLVKKNVHKIKDTTTSRSVGAAAGTV